MFYLGMFLGTFIYSIFQQRLKEKRKFRLDRMKGDLALFQTPLGVVIIDALFRAAVTTAVVAGVIGIFNALNS